MKKLFQVSILIVAIGIAQNSQSMMQSGSKVSLDYEEPIDPFGLSPKMNSAETDCDDSGIFDMPGACCSETDSALPGFKSRVFYELHTVPQKKTAYDTLCPVVNTNTCKTFCNTQKTSGWDPQIYCVETNSYEEPDFNPHYETRSNPIEIINADTYVFATNGNTPPMSRLKTGDAYDTNSTTPSTDRLRTGDAYDTRSAVLNPIINEGPRKASTSWEAQEPKVYFNHLFKNYHSKHANTFSAQKINEVRLFVEGASEALKPFFANPETITNLMKKYIKIFNAQVKNIRDLLAEGRHEKNVFHKRSQENKRRIIDAIIELGRERADLFTSIKTARNEILARAALKALFTTFMTETQEGHEHFYVITSAHEEMGNQLLESSYLSLAAQGLIQERLQQVKQRLKQQRALANQKRCVSLSKEKPGDVLCDVVLVGKPSSKAPRTDRKH